jgi:gliding motility-associated transport system ATP-binding protein
MCDSKVIHVEGLTKEYPETVAVDRISFSVSRGEVVGFLGPNGAGKTTTLKMLTCFMPATSGNATVAGYDIATQSLQVRRSIGYLPEHNAIYDEMRVAEYLRFRAALKKVPWRKRKENVDEAIQMCGLKEVAQRVVGQLSKGYRQRVGLADTVVSKPPVLILDEPTSGMDPGQIVEVRELIRHLGKENTVLLSTHHLPEVEHICDRVVIIDQGRIVLDATLEELKKSPEGKAQSLEEVFLQVTDTPMSFWHPEPEPEPEKEEDIDEEERS